ncbi:MAG: Cof-like hydrolase [Lacrimispora sp.]|jgi:Cof subfamily protein (haloacid dehalogenase superfamily)|nr:Cof-like hydrolase [Lacrimispora sp.]
MIRLVASDMDGTLLNRYGKVSLKNQAAVHALNRRNIGFVVCTGRNYADAYAPLKEAGISCDIICMNGAAVFSSEGEQIRKQTLFKSQISRILNICQPFSVLYDFMTDEGSYTTSSPEEFKASFENKIFLSMVSEEHTFETIVKRFQFVSEEVLLHSETDIYKMSIVHEDPQVLSYIRSCLEKEEGISIASSAATNLEITHFYAQKGNALLEYAINAKIHPREILAMGDSENDLSMLILPLGYTVAMDNGSDVIKKNARLVTRSNEEDGVAAAIETLVLSDAALATG